MNFTTRKPARFIDDQALVRKIHSVCQIAKVCHVDTKRFVESSELVLSDLVRLADAASVVKGEPVETASEVAEWLFEEDAIAFLEKKCRNRYFLWMLLEQLATTTFPVNLLALARAHARVKAKIMDKRYGFQWTTPNQLIYTLKGLPPGFVFELWEEGKLLASRKSISDGFGIILNPLLIDD